MVGGGQAKVAAAPERNKRRKEDQDDFLRAVVVGEPVGRDEVGLHTAFPSDLPYALLPLCNTPILDYILENLLENGVDEVHVIVNAKSFAKVREHLSNHITSWGKSWLESDAISVRLVAADRPINKLAEAAWQLVDGNIIPSGTSFLFVPIDCISSFTNLRECFRVHRQRRQTLEAYAATLVCTSTQLNLQSTLHNLLLPFEQGRRIDEEDATGANSGAADHGKAFFSFDMCSKLQPRPVATHPSEHHTLFVLNANQCVTEMVRLGASEANELVVPFKQGTQYSVRLDLIPTGFLFCEAAALSLFEFHATDLYTFLRSAVLGQMETLRNQFGALEVSSQAAVVQPVNSFDSFIVANMEICARRLFPLTRESSFSDHQAKYAVGAMGETVYLHTSAKTYSKKLGPNVVLGENVTVPDSVELVGTVLGADVVIHGNCRLVDCVVLDGATVEENCVLSRCIIGHGATIRCGVELQRSVISPQTVVDAATVLQGETVLTEDDSDEEDDDEEECLAEEDADVWMLYYRSCAGGGSQQTVARRWRSGIHPTHALFDRDAPEEMDSSVVGDGDDYDEDEFRRRVAKHVDYALGHGVASIHLATEDLRNMCKLYSIKGNNYVFEDLCTMVTELLVEHVLREDKGTDPTGRAALDAARHLFGQWCRPFYEEVCTSDDRMVATIRGLCTAIGSPTCVLRKLVSQLMEVLYNDCDDDRYDAVGFCIVSGESLVLFHEEVEGERAARATYAVSDDDSASTNAIQEEQMLEVAALASTYICSVKAFLQESG